MLYRFNNKEEEHLHEMSEDGKLWQPLTGTSQVVSVISKPLTWWASGLAVEKFGWINSKNKINGKYIEVPKELRLEKAMGGINKIMELDVEGYLKLLDEAYKAHSVFLKETAEEGTDTHALCEDYVKSVMAGLAVEPEDEKVKKFARWSEKNVKRFLWSEMYCFSPTHFLGGISDCGAELMNGNYVIIDFKRSKDVYFTHLVQIAGYDIQIAENGGYTEKGEKVFTLDKPITKYLVVPFGISDIEETLKIQIESPISPETYRKCFIETLDLYRNKNRYENFS